MSCLIRVNLFTWGPGPPQTVNADNVIYGEALGRTESACSLEGLEIKVSHRQSAMCMWLTPNKNPGLQGTAELPWLAMHLSHPLLGEISTVPTTPLGEDTQKPHAWSLLDPSHVPVPVPRACSLCWLQSGSFHCNKLSP